MDHYDVRIMIKFTPDYKASEPIFWHVFKELSRNNNNGSVNYDKLQEGLISTGKFYAGEAVLMIEHMEKIGKIEKTENYNAYRIGNSVTTKEEEGWDDMR
jgi:hypothetical protein